MSLLTKSVAFLAVSSVSVQALAQDPAAAQKSGFRAATIKDDVTVTPVNAGINPQAFALQINANVQIGGNPCEARGVTAKLTQNVVNGVIRVKAVKKISENTPRICPQIFAPVYQPVKLTVRGLKPQIKDVVIYNVGEFGRNVSAFKLILILGTFVDPLVGLSTNDTTEAPLQA